MPWSAELERTEADLSSPTPMPLWPLGLVAPALPAPATTAGGDEAITTIAATTARTPIAIQVLRTGRHRFFFLSFSSEGSFIRTTTVVTVRDCREWLARPCRARGSGGKGWAAANLPPSERAKTHGPPSVFVTFPGRDVPKRPSPTASTPFSPRELTPTIAARVLGRRQRLKRRHAVLIRSRPSASSRAQAAASPNALQPRIARARGKSSRPSSRTADSALVRAPSVSPSSFVRPLRGPGGLQRRRDLQHAGHPPTAGRARRPAARRWASILLHSRRLPDARLNSRLYRRDVLDERIGHLRSPHDSRPQDVDSALPASS